MDAPPANPYAAPATINESYSYTTTSDVELATLSSRFVGSLVDGIIMAAVGLPLMFALGAALALAGITFDGLIAEKILQVISLAVVGGVFAAINGYLLAKRGQTIGKLIVKTQIVSYQGNILPL